MLPSCQSAPTRAACGRPSGRDVPRKTSGSGALARRSCARIHASSEDPYRSRLVTWIGVRSVIAFLQFHVSQSRASVVGGALLHRPAVAVGIAEKDERVPVPASSINPDSSVEVLDRADLHTLPQQLLPGGVD